MQDDAALPVSIESAYNKLVSKLKIRRIGIVATFLRLMPVVLISFALAGCETSREYSSRLTTTPAFNSRPQAAIRPTPELPAPLTNVTVVPEEIVLAQPEALIVAPPPVRAELTNAAPP